MEMDAQKIVKGKSDLFANLLLERNHTDINYVVTVPMNQMRMKNETIKIYLMVTDEAPNELLNRGITVSTV
jgi:hypothetical protein